MRLYNNLSKLGPIFNFVHNEADDAKSHLKKKKSHLRSSSEASSNNLSCNIILHFYHLLVKRNELGILCTFGLTDKT